MYARVRYPEGRESNVSLRDLAPCPSSDANDDMPTVPIPAEGNESPVGTRELINPGSTEMVLEAVPRGEDRTHGRINPVSPVPDVTVAENNRGDMNPGSIERVIEPQNSHDTNTRRQRQSSRINRGVPPPRYGINSCAWVNRGWADHFT